MPYWPVIFYKAISDGLRPLRPNLIQVTTIKILIRLSEGPEVRVKVIAQKVLLDLTLNTFLQMVASIGSVQTIEAYVESIEDTDTQTDQSYQ